MDRMRDGGGLGDDGPHAPGEWSREARREEGDEEEVAPCFGREGEGEGATDKSSMISFISNAENRSSLSENSFLVGRGKGGGKKQG